MTNESRAHALPSTIDHRPSTETKVGEDALVINGARKSFRAAKRSGSWWAVARGKATRTVEEARAVDDVSLTVRKGEIYGLLGSNGSGKSTLIRLVSTLLLPDAGVITVFGHDVVTQEAAVKRMINRVSVEAAFFKKLSPMENLIYAARLYDVDPAYARREIVRILNALGIKTSRIGQPLEKMSRGMQQKVAIARALLTSPILLLLDEPTTGLDPRSKKDVQEFILRVRAEHGATIVLTSHDMEESDRLCDRIAFIDGGRLVREDTPLALKQDYARRHDMGDALPSLEDVFLEVVGRSLGDADYEDDDDKSDKKEKEEVSV
jgi:ABC-2 type transport system ATP-binding protein